MDFKFLFFFIIDLDLTLDLALDKLNYQTTPKKHMKNTKTLKHNKNKIKTNL